VPLFIAADLLMFSRMKKAGNNHRCPQWRSSRFIQLCGVRDAPYPETFSETLTQRRSTVAVNHNVTPGSEPTMIGRPERCTQYRM
jgi:hypothetical protein